MGIEKRIGDLLARHGRAQQPGALCKLGDELLRTEQVDGALRCFDRALQIDPRCARAWAGRGEALSKLNRVGEALACTERALAHDGALDAAFVLKGDLLRRVGSLDEALACYDSALDLAPDDERVLLRRAELLGKIGRHDEAAKSYARALDMTPENADAWYGLVVVRSEALDADGARKALDRLVVIAPDDPRVAGARSLVVQIERRLASKATAKATPSRPPPAAEVPPPRTKDPRRDSDAPASCDGELDVAATHHREGRHVDALRILERLTKESPTDVRVWILRARVLVALGKPDIASTSLERATALDDRSVEAWKLASRCAVEQKKYERGLEAAERACALAPKDPEGHRLRGDALVQVGRHLEAVYAYEKAVLYDRSDVDGWLSLGRILRLLRRVEPARAALTKARDLAEAARRADAFAEARDLLSRLS